MTFYMRFSELCEKKGVSASEVAKAIGLSNSIASYWKHGLLPKYETAKALAEYFGVSMNVLMGEEEHLDECIDENSMLCMDFYRAMKEHCIRMNAECENCCMRLYCYTPPCEKTDSMMANVISFLATAQSCTGNENHSDHCTGAVQMPCPCNMDMSTALGYEPRQ